MNVPFITLVVISLAKVQLFYEISKKIHGNFADYDLFINFAVILSKKSKFDRKKMTLRGKLVDIALEWQESFGVAPSITSAISEYDAAMLID